MKKVFILALTFLLTQTLFGGSGGGYSGGYSGSGGGDTSAIEGDIDSLIGDITQSSVAYDDGAGTAGVIPYDSMDNDHPYYFDGGAFEVYFESGEWFLNMGMAQYTHPSQSYLPPRTGWMRLGSVDPDVTVDFIGAGGGGLDDSTIPNLTLAETLATNDLVLVNIDGTNQSATVETLATATLQTAYAGTGRFILAANDGATNMLATLPVFNNPKNEIVSTLRDTSGLAIPVVVEASSWQTATGSFTDGEIPDYPFDAYDKYAKLGSSTTGGTTDVYRVSGLPDRPVVVKWWSHDNFQTTNMTVEIIGTTTNTMTGYDIGTGTATPEVSTNLPLDGVLIVRLSATDDNYGINMIEFGYAVEAPFVYNDRVGAKDFIGMSNGVPYAIQTHYAWTNGVWTSFIEIEEVE